MFVTFLLAHLMGDFLLQPTRWVVHKEANKITSKYLYFHVLVHFGITMLLLWDVDLWQWAAMIALSHYLIDLAKLYANPYFKNGAVTFFIDQLLHILVLYACAYSTDLTDHTLMLLREMDWALVTAIVFVGAPTSI
ncbi:MAG TPA: DUF3307 domain-containing protein, partial [Arenibacter sp.]|nr:DUF3307 domain-containing protein [Arenibacter sp.]